MSQHYYFTSDTARAVLFAAETQQTKIRLSLDLNRSTRQWRIENKKLLLDTRHEVDIRLFKAIADNTNRIYLLKEGKLAPVEIRSGGYYKLSPTDTVPTLEINGIKMHRSATIDPFTDARLKTQLVVQPGDLVLDTCGGLGYSAVWALKNGAAHVVSTEKDPNVLEIRQLNPWSETPGGLELIRADITRYIPTFSDRTFHSIIHDPPRFTSATGDLYGKPFYRELHRVLKNRGMLFHYTGNPGRIKANDRFLTNTRNRLEQTGFGHVKFIERLQGFTAKKKSC